MLHDVAISICNHGSQITHRHNQVITTYIEPSTLCVAGVLGDGSIFSSCIS